MNAPEKSNSFTDVSSRAQSTLDYIISGTEEKRAAKKASQMPVSQALEAEQVVQFQSSRTKARVMFLASDQNALNEDSPTQKHLREVCGMFEEVHLVVLTNGKQRDYPNKRFAENAWVYKVNFPSTWFLNEVLDNFAMKQMQFGEGFRPDVIVALDPFYAGKAGTYLSKRYDRPLQVHVLVDFLQPDFVELKKGNKDKVSIAKQVLKRAKSVRTNSSLLKEKLAKQFPKIEDLGMLPRHFDSDAMVKAKRSNVLKEKYPQYVFIILTAGTLDQNNTIFRTMDASRQMLFSPRIGLVIVGQGPMRDALEKRAEILDIKEQVVFESDMSLLPDYMLSADMFVCSDTSAVGDEYVIQAAAAGLPIVMAKTPLRNDLFVDGESGLLVDPDDTVGFAHKMNSILNTNAFRLQFATNARLVIKDRLHTDPEMYKTAYRDTIGVVFDDMRVPSPRDEIDVAADVAATANTTGAPSTSTQEPRLA